MVVNIIETLYVLVYIMERELNGYDYDILQAIAESEGMDSSSRSKRELIQRIIEHRQQQREPERDREREMADLQLRDIDYIRERLIEKGFNEMISQTIENKDSLILIYGTIIDLEQSSLDELRFAYRDIKSSIPHRSQWLGFLPGDGSDINRDVIINRLMRLLGNRTANNESRERGRIQERERLRQALESLPDIPAIPANMRDGAPSQLGVPRVASPGGGAGMAIVDEKPEIVSSLVSMGIDLATARQAAMRTSSVEAALDWVTSKR